MKLKCIGGERDGEWFDVENVMRVGDYIRLPETYKPVEHNFRPNYIPESIVRDEIIYRIEEIKFSVDGKFTYESFKFLVTQYPARMTFEQALKHQFSK